MTRRKALIVALSVAGVAGSIFVALLMSHPVTAVSHASYTWKPGCHCGAPKTTTTAKATTTTAKKVTTTTAKATTTTARKATTTTATVATTTSGQASSTTSPPVSTTKSAKKNNKKSTTSTSASSGERKDALGLGAAVSSFPGGGSGSSGGDGSGGAGVLDGEATAAESLGPPHYYLSPVAIAFLFIYGVSFVLYRTKRVKVATHRKVWNVLLLGTFLLCGVMGLVLAVGVTRPTPWHLPTWLLVWHVETGIAMCFISFFHIGWHLRYYLALVTGKRRAQRPERAAVRERVDAGERMRSPRPARLAPERTEAERRLAFEQRQASHPSSAPAAQPATARSEAERWLEEARRRAAPAS
jgi:hypothetical protein